MILVDTSVWVSHFREGNTELQQLLNEGDIVCHPFIIGELACGNIQNRSEIFILLSSLPMVKESNHHEVLVFIEKKKFMGKGLGYIDVHLLASALLSNVAIWSFDNKLNETAAELGMNYERR